MIQKVGTRSGEGLRAARLLMVLSSMSPLFVLWAIRGSDLVPDLQFAILCTLLILVPNVVLWMRVRVVKRQDDRRMISIGESRDHREHILVYLFAIMLPFYSQDLSSWRNLISSVVALGFIVFLFWHLRLHYMNLIFAMLGYRVFAVYPPRDNNEFTDRSGKILITWRSSLDGVVQIDGYRVSDTVFLEVT